MAVTVGFEPACRPPTYGRLPPTRVIPRIYRWARAPSQRSITLKHLQDRLHLFVDEVGHVVASASAQRHDVLRARAPGWLPAIRTAPPCRSSDVPQTAYRQCRLGLFPWSHNGKGAVEVGDCNGDGCRWNSRTEQGPERGLEADRYLRERDAARWNASRSRRRRGRRSGQCRPDQLGRVGCDSGRVRHFSGRPASSEGEDRARRAAAGGPGRRSSFYDQASDRSLDHDDQSLC